jgi:hypothetical protein
MTAEFTKTWTYKIHPSSKHFQDYAIKEEGTSAFVAQIFGTSKRDALPYARLIGAAPDMYEALEQAELSTTQIRLAADIGRKSAKDKVAWYVSQLEQLGREIQTALAKAKGETL